MGEIQALYSKYLHKYPLYTNEKIVDMMLDDGVITFEDAKKIRSGLSLFSIDNQLSNTIHTGKDFNITKILGGEFSNTKEKSKINFNKRIETTFQSSRQGDCWLLSGINALNQTAWGKQAICDAIVPDKDGRGGVTIKFRGSPIKKKNIYISAQQIKVAKQSGNYSKGDDDMIALELATEITFREMVKQGIAQRTSTDEELQKEKINYRSYINGGVANKDFRQYPIAKLLGIGTTELNFFVINGYNSKNSLKEKDKILKFLSTQKNNATMWCSFAGEAGNKHVHGNHAYAVKRMEYNKEVVLIDPYYSNKEIKISWKDFITLIDYAQCISPSTNFSNKIKQHLPTYYNNKNDEFNKRFNPYRF